MSIIKMAILGYNKIKTVDALKKGIQSFEQGVSAQEMGKSLAMKSKIIPLSEKRRILLGN